MPKPEARGFSAWGLAVNSEPDTVVRVNDVKTDWSVSFSDGTGPWREMQQRKKQGRMRLTFWV